jgi:hypothetical protein
MGRGGGWGRRGGWGRGPGRGMAWRHGAPLADEPYLGRQVDSMALSRDDLLEELRAQAARFEIELKGIREQIEQLQEVEADAK